MADPKRQSGGGKVAVATPNIGSTTGMASLETSLSGCIGARIRFTTVASTNSTLEGTLFAVDTLTNLVAINTSPPPPTPLSPTASSTQAQPGDYHIIPITRISTFQILSLSPSLATSPTASDTPSFTTATTPIHALDLRALKARENAAISRLHERESRRGKGVSREAQDIFDALSRTMPARWDGTSIIVADSVIIKAPYHSDDCRTLKEGEGTQAVGRVIKVLEMERQKINLRNSANKMNAAAAVPRVAIPTPSIPSVGMRKGG